jgi:hypothetical protein
MHAAAVRTPMVPAPMEVPLRARSLQLRTNTEAIVLIVLSAR